MTTNKHGLSRTVPPEMKREVRRRAGFGCVCCGLAIGQYEHVDPEFADALSHEVDGITYLCGSCHDRVTRGVLSKSTVKAAQQDPWALKHGRCHDAFDIGTTNVAFWVCGHKCVNVHRIVEIDGHPLLGIRPPKAAGEPFELSAEITDANGNVLFELVNNEWEGDPRAWDIECVGPRVFVRGEGRRLVLQILAVPPRGLVIERLDVRHNDVRVFGTRKDGLSIQRDGYPPRAILGNALITGGSDDALFLSVAADGNGTIGGAGTQISLQGNPEVVPWRHSGHHDPCSCGSALQTRRCCGKILGAP